MPITGQILTFIAHTQNHCNFVRSQSMILSTLQVSAQPTQDHRHSTAYSRALTLDSVLQIIESVLKIIDTRQCTQDHQHSTVYSRSLTPDSVLQIIDTRQCTLDQHSTVYSRLSTLDSVLKIIESVLQIIDTRQCTQDHRHSTEYSGSSKVYSRSLTLDSVLKIIDT